MNRILAAALLSPVGVLLGAWIGQYVFPLAALGHDVVRIDGVTYGTGQPAPLPAIVFFAPTKLSISLALATYLVVLFLAVPVGAFLNRKGKATLLVAVAVGALAAIGAMKLFSVMLPATANVLFREQAHEYCAFIGAVAGAWYWFCAYCPLSAVNAALARTRRFFSPHNPPL